VIDQKWRNDSSAVKDRYRYGYDRNSNRLYRENVVAGDASASFDELYAYDGLNRLAERTRGDLNEGKTAITNEDRGESWTLDQLGNWTQYGADNGVASLLHHNRDNNAANEITAISGEGMGQPAWVDPDYDAAGNQTRGPKPGSLDDGETRYWLVYDAWSRLVKVYEDDDDDSFEPSTGETLLAAYAYDGLHRRVRKTVDPDGADTDYDYYYNTKWQVLEIRADGDNAYPFKQYIWDLRYIDAPVCRIRDADTDGQNLETLYYTTDANMNVTALLEPDGDVVERYCYDAYGRLTVLDDDWSDDADNASDVDNEILYCGYRFDSETGYYHVRHRVYDPSLGRWVQRDPAGDLDGGMGLYEYVASGPTMGIDPLGLVRIPIITRTVTVNETWPFPDKILATDVILGLGQKVGQCCIGGKRYPAYSLSYVEIKAVLKGSASITGTITVQNWWRIRVISGKLRFDFGLTIDPKITVSANFDVDIQLSNPKPANKTLCILDMAAAEKDLKDQAAETAKKFVKLREDTLKNVQDLLDAAKKSKDFRDFLGKVKQKAIAEAKRKAKEALEDLQKQYAPQ